MLSIWVVTGVLVYLAVERLLSNEYEIRGEAMLITSACAVAVNLMCVALGVGLERMGGSCWLMAKANSLLWECPDWLVSLGHP